VSFFLPAFAKATVGTTSEALAKAGNTMKISPNFNLVRISVSRERV